MCPRSTTAMPRPPALFPTTSPTPYSFSLPGFPALLLAVFLHSSLPALHLAPLTSRPDPSPAQLPPPPAPADSPPPSPGPKTPPGRLTLMPCSTRTCSRSSSPKVTLLPPWLLSLPPMPARVARPRRAPLLHRLPAAPLPSQRLPTYPLPIGGGRGAANSAARCWRPGAVHAGGCSLCRERVARPAPGKLRAPTRLRDSGETRSCPGVPALHTALGVSAASKLPVQLPLLHVQLRGFSQVEEG